MILILRRTFAIFLAGAGRHETKFAYSAVKFTSETMAYYGTMEMSLHCCRRSVGEVGANRGVRGACGGRGCGARHCGNSKGDRSAAVGADLQRGPVAARV